MERHKWRALHHVLKRTGHDVTAYLDALRPMEERVRSCYDGRVAWMPANDFAQCLVLDGTFVLEPFRGALDGAKGFVDDLGYSRQTCCSGSSWATRSRRGPCQPRRAVLRTADADGHAAAPE